MLLTKLQQTSGKQIVKTFKKRGDTDHQGTEIVNRPGSRYTDEQGIQMTKEENGQDVQTKEYRLRIRTNGHRSSRHSDDHRKETTNTFR